MCKWRVGCDPPVLHRWHNRGLAACPSGPPSRRLSILTDRYFDPPPTKCTISSWSWSFNFVCGQRSRGTISWLSSIATRSGFMASSSTSAVKSSAEVVRGWPLMVRFMESTSWFRSWPDNNLTAAGLYPDYSGGYRTRAYIKILNRGVR
jgi:hypothetical protein